MGKKKKKLNVDFLMTLLYFYVLMEIPKFNIPVLCPTIQEAKMNDFVWLLFILDLYYYYFLIISEREIRGRKSE